MSAAPDRWFLSFDCATKSFAFALIRIRDPAEALAAAAAAAQKGPEELFAAIRALDAETRACFHVAAGAAVDLVPQKKDKDIPTVERVRAVKEYLEGPVAAALAAAAADGCPGGGTRALHVAVEFQMGVNAPARTVAAVLVAHYARADVFLVGPALKNKLWYPARPDIRHCFFVERYAKLYDANKAHAKALYFDHIAPLFGHSDYGVPPPLRKDFADSVVQVLGFLAFGDLEKAAEKF